jgi:hypothetical protein
VLSKEDFAATVGYQGASAVVDKRVRSKIKKMGPIDALKEGMFRPGFAAALYDSQVHKNHEILSEAVEFLSKVFNSQLSVDQAKRMLGIQRVPQEIEKVILL